MLKRDEIIDMASKVYGTKDFHESALFHLEAFAKLVAAKEREACANLCEDQTQEYYSDGSNRAMNYQCADAIRARGNEA